MKLLMFLMSALLCGSMVLAFPMPVENVPSQCADPTFACQDIESARLCRVVKSCVHDIWATMSAPDDNDEICDICKEMVKEARDQLLSNMTQEEIKEVFEGSCKLLPVKLIAEGCIKIVDEIIPELVEMLASRMDPNMVCTVSGLCNLAHVPMGNSIVREFRKLFAVRQDNHCDQCVTMMTDMETFLKSTSEADVKTYLENICNQRAPKYLCDLLVDDYFPSAYQYVINTQPKELCSAIGVCARLDKCSSNSKVVGDELTCEFCEHVLEHVKEMITANTTMEEFRTALLNFCKHVGSFSAECTSLVNDYYDMIFDYIKKMDTQGMCTLMGLCQNQKCHMTPLVKLVPALEMRKKTPFVKLSKASPILLPSNNIDLEPVVNVVPPMTFSKERTEDSNDIFEIPLLPVEKFSHPVMAFERDNDCAFCKAIIYFLKQDLNGVTGKDSVRKAIDGVCDKWITEFPDYCHHFMNKYSIKMQHAIAKEEDMEKVCSSLAICEVGEMSPGTEAPSLPNREDDLLCTLCKDVMSEVEKALNDPETKKKIENLLEQACAVLPQSMTKDCDNFIDQNVETVIELLKQEMTPDNVCPAIRLCPSASRVQKAQPLKDLECDVCKDVVTSLREKLEDPQAKTVVLTFLEEGCERLPETMAQKCKSYVDDNINAIMSFLKQELDPNTVCSVLKICPQSVFLKKTKANDVECDFCKEVVSKVEDLVKDKKTEDEIRTALEKVCGYLPSSMSAKCKTFVDEYAEMVIQLIVQEADPSMVCAALNLCPKNASLAELQLKEQSIECEGCQYALHFIQNELMNQQTQAKVTAYLEKLCDLLPEAYAQNCAAFFNQYGSAFLALLAQEMDPSTVCWEIKLCGNQTAMLKILEQKYVSPLQKFQMDECSVCTTVVDYLDKLLEEDDVDREITAIVEKVCTVVPASFKDKCTTVLETYGPYILQMIGQMADSRQVCQDIDLCSTPPGHVHLLGGHKCTFGPSYWCKTDAHAAACKAEMYCKEKMGKI